jgi:hypothetical protein
MGFNKSLERRQDGQTPLKNKEIAAKTIDNICDLLIKDAIIIFPTT